MLVLNNPKSCSTNYMRYFVEKCQDDSLSSTITRIEERLGKILAKHSDKVEICEVQRNHKSEWIFWYRQDREYSCGDIFHELMHLSMWIEGWPIVRADAYATENGKTVATSLINLTHHVEIWEREKRCGFSQEMRWNGIIENEILPTKDKYRVWNEERDGVDVERTAQNWLIQLSGALLSPASASLGNHLRDSLQETLPWKAFLQVNAIHQLYSEHAQGFPKALSVVLLRVERILKLRSGFLATETFSRADSAFFAPIGAMFSHQLNA